MDVEDDEPSHFDPACLGGRFTTTASTGVTAAGQKTVNDYRFLSVAGRGTYCKVKWAQDSSGRRYAVKVFSKTALERQHVSHFDQHGATTKPLRRRVEEELAILSSVCHDHVLRLVEVINDFEHENLYIVLEGLEGGQLMNWSPAAPGYSVTAAASTSAVVVVYREGLARRLFQQLLGAMAYLHGRGVIHKDLKPDNILLSEAVPGAPDAVRTLDLSPWPTVATVGGADVSSLDGFDPQSHFSGGQLQAKIGDFNVAALCEQPDCLIYDAEGTTLFTPPECFEHHSKGIKGMARDMWSLGCVLFTMLVGRCPFWAAENIFLQLEILRGEVFIPDGLMSPGAESLIRGLMAKDVGDRLSAKAAMEHPWIKFGQNLASPEVAAGC